MLGVFSFIVVVFINNNFVSSRATIFVFGNSVSVYTHTYRN